MLGAIALFVALAAITLPQSTSASQREAAHHSENFRLHTAAGAPHAEQTLGLLERDLQATMALLGETWPRDRVVDYVLYRDRDAYLQGSGCPPTTRGCYMAGQVHTTSPLHRHELVHAYADAVWGPSHRFLAEGLAEALACHPGRPTPGRSWRDAYRDFRGDPAGAYDVASALVTHLIDVYGVERFASLYRGVGPRDPIDAFERAVVAIYGRTVDELLATLDSVAAPRCLSAARAS